MSKELTVIRSHFRSLGFTLRKTKDPETVTQQHYINQIDRFNHIHEVTVQPNWVFETKSGLHVHGVIIVPKNFAVTRLRYRGWHLHLVELYDPVGWYTYCQKEQDDSFDNNGDYIDNTPDQEDPLLNPKLKKLFS